MADDSPQTDESDESAKTGRRRRGGGLRVDGGMRLSRLERIDGQKDSSEMIGYHGGVSLCYWTVEARWCKQLMTRLMPQEVTAYVSMCETCEGQDGMRR